MVTVISQAYMSEKEKEPETGSSRPNLQRIRISGFLCAVLLGYLYELKSIQEKKIAQESLFDVLEIF